MSPANLHLKPLMRICLVLIFAALTFTTNANASTYQEDFKVGDVVEFDFLGKPYQAEIFDFTGTGWPKVKFEYRGKLTERFFPPSRLKLVESAKDGATDQNMAPPAKMRKWTPPVLFGEAFLKQTMTHLLLVQGTRAIPASGSGPTASRDWRP